MRTDKKIKKLICTIFICLAIISCKKEPMKTPTDDNKTKTNYSWSCSVTSIKDYPIEITTGYLATKKDFIAAFRNNGIEDDGWDVDGQEGGSGGNQIPSLLSLTWVSYAEKKVWFLDEGALPSDKILALFQEGFYNIDNASQQPVHETYQHIVVGVAPGGVVVVFLTGDFHRVEVARFQATETAEDVNKTMRRPGIYKDTKAFVEDGFKTLFTAEQQANFKNNGIPFGLWDTYRTRYNWRFDMKFYKEEDKLAKNTHVQYINGEEDKLDLKEANKFKNQTLPKTVTFYYKNNWNEAIFDETEIVEAFKKATQDNPQAEVTIIANVQFMYKSVKFAVKCGDKEINLQKVTVEAGGYGQ